MSKTIKKKKELKLLWFVVLLLSARFWLNSIEHGQINIQLWTLVLLAVYFVKAKKQLVAGLLMGLATVTKVLPLLFLFYFFWKKEYRFVLFTFFWIVIMLILPGVLLGWGHNINLLSAWYYKVIHPALVDGTIGAGDSNQSLPALLTRFLANVPANEQTGASVNILSLPLQTVGIINKIVFLVFISLIVLFIHLPIRKASSGNNAKAKLKENLELSMVFLTCVLLPALAWKAYYVAAIVAYTTTVYAVMKMKDGLFRRVSIILLAVSFFLHTFTADGMWGWRLAHIFQSYSCVTFSILTLHILLLMMLIRLAVDGSDFLKTNLLSAR
jgi:hypothetical protein